MSLFKKNTSNSLIHKDQLYKSVISKLPAPNRINYCESLIYRTKNDLLHSKCQIKKNRLKKLLIAAEIEKRMLKRTFM